MRIDLRGDGTIRFSLITFSRPPQSLTMGIMEGFTFLSTFLNRMLEVKLLNVSMCGSEMGLAIERTTRLSVTMMAEIAAD